MDISLNLYLFKKNFFFQFFFFTFSTNKISYDSIPIIWIFYRHYGNKTVNYSYIFRILRLFSLLSIFHNSVLQTGSNCRLTIINCQLTNLRVLPLSFASFGLPRTIDILSWDRAQPYRDLTHGLNSHYKFSRKYFNLCNFNLLKVAF